MNSVGGEDRRLYPRSRKRVPLSVSDADPGILNHVDNISANGILCHTVKPVPLMTKLGIALELPKPADRRIECEGIVVRCEADEVGDDHFKVAILYTKINEEDRQALEHFVNEDLEASSATGSQGASASLH